MNLVKPLIVTAALMAVLVGCADQEATTDHTQPAAAPQAAPNEAQPAAADTGREPMMQMGEAAPQPGQQHSATGKITALDTGAGTLTVAHEPVASLNWPAMTMSFELRDPSAVGNLQVGDDVQFSFIPVEGGGFVITEISK